MICLTGDSMIVGRWSGGEADRGEGRSALRGDDDQVLGCATGSSGAERGRDDGAPKAAVRDPAFSSTSNRLWVGIGGRVKDYIFLKSKKNAILEFGEVV